jgi:hypothetical protein
MVRVGRLVRRTVVVAVISTARATHAIQTPPAASPRDSTAAPSRTALSTDSLAVLVAGIVPRVERMRGAKFRRAVPVVVESDSAASVYFKARIDRSTSPGALEAQARAWVRLGLLPSGTNLRQLMLDLLAEQAGGYYDPERKVFAVLGDMPAAVAPTIVAHELTHALDDQVFDIDSTLARVGSDDDRESAFGCVVEGAGTLVMTKFMADEMASGRLSLAGAASVLESDFARAELLRQAPDAIRRSLLAPYILGMQFLLRGDATAVLEPIHAADIDRAFRDPPRSMEQVLHANKYWDESARDEPRPIAPIDSLRILGPTWHEEGTGVLGELVLATLTGAAALDLDTVANLDARDWTTRAAAGWGGDRWWLFSNGAEDAVILATLWDTSRDANEFAVSLRDRPTLAVEREAQAVVVLAGVPTNRRHETSKRALDTLLRSTHARH